MCNTEKRERPALVQTESQEANLRKDDHMCNAFSYLRFCGSKIYGNRLDKKEVIPPRGLLIRLFPKPASCIRLHSRFQK
jgi:hypothetical protein